MTLHTEIGRRAALTGGAGLAALALASCGHDEHSSHAESAAPTAPTTTRTPPSNSPNAVSSSTRTSAAARTTGNDLHPSSVTSPSARPPAPTTPAANPKTSTQRRQASTAAKTPTAGSTSSSPTPSPTPTPTGPPPGAIVPLSAVAVGGSISATVQGKPIVLSRPNAGSVAGFSAICTHQGCTVNTAGGQLPCPCHGSTFNAFTGAVIQGPAAAPLPVIDVGIDDGYIVAR